jgi:glycosyltransferase involved in cell wall biosynthesis
MLPVPPTLYGGIERIVALLVRHLRARGHTVGLVAHPESTEPCDAFFAWPRPDLRGASAHWGNARALGAAVRAFRPDLLHSFSRLAYMGRQLVGALPKVMSYQREPSRRTVAGAARLAGRSLTFTGCSEYIAAQGRRAGGTWHAIPNFVDCARFAPVLEVPEDAPLVFLSRIERIKGAHEAIAIARAAGRRLVLAGNRAESGPEATYFRDDIAPHLSGTDVQWVGPVDDTTKAHWLGQAAAMLLPLQWDEPFGIVMAEALACGTPVIAYRRGAAPEIVRDGVDGFIVNTREAAVAAVAQLGRVSRAGCRARAEAAFDARVVVPQYESLYLQLTDT